MAVEFFLRDLAGDAVSAIGRRGDNTAIVLDRAHYQLLSIEARVQLINRVLVEAQRPSAPRVAPYLELLAS